MTTLTSAERGRVLDRLRELVEIETPSLDREASDRIADALAERYERLGGTVARHRNETGTHLVIDFDGPGDTLLLVGHSDTVWPIGSLAERVPYRRTAATIAGPGAYDMKSGLVVIETALALASATGRRRAVRVVVTADEEVGSPGSRPIVEAAAVGAMGAIGFESPHPDGALKVGRRGSTRIRWEVTGREAHAALDPEKGVSAIDELIDQLIRMRAYLDDLADDGYPVIANIGTIQGGSRANVVSGRAEAEVGLRFVDPVTEAGVLRALASPVPVRPAARSVTTVISNRPAWSARPIDEEFAGELGALAGEAFETRAAAGAGDINFVAALGIPCVDGFGPRGRGAHAADEQILIESMIDRIRLLAGILTPPEPSVLR